MHHQYDVIVVGARCAGSPLAMLQRRYAPDAKAQRKDAKQGYHSSLCGLCAW